MARRPLRLSPAFVEPCHPRTPSRPNAALGDSSPYLLAGGTRNKPSLYQGTTLHSTPRGSARPAARRRRRRRHSLEGRIEALDGIHPRLLASLLKPQPCDPRRCHQKDDDQIHHVSASSHSRRDTARLAAKRRKRTHLPTSRCSPSAPPIAGRVTDSDTAWSDGDRPSEAALRGPGPAVSGEEPG